MEHLHGYLTGKIAFSTRKIGGFFSSKEIVVLRVQYKASGLDDCQPSLIGSLHWRDATQDDVDSIDLHARLSKIGEL
jgi:hypothetical protein